MQLSARRQVSWDTSKSVDFFPVKYLAGGFDLRVQGLSAVGGKIAALAIDTIFNKDLDWNFTLDLGDLIGTALKMVEQFAKPIVSSRKSAG